MERRDNSRRPVSWHVRLWFADGLFFLDGRAANASSGGLGIDVPLPATQSIIKSGEQYRIDVTPDGEAVLQETMTARHVGDHRVGMQFEEPHPAIVEGEAAEPAEAKVEEKGGAEKR